MRPGGDRVDAVPRQRRAHVVEVVAVELLRIVELVVVDVALEPGDGSRHTLGCRLPRVLRLIATRDEAGDHRAESPDAETGLHESTPRYVTGSFAPPADERRIASVTSEQR